MGQKATKKTPANQNDFRQTVLEAALTLAEELGWMHVTMSDIAQESGYTLGELHDAFADKGEIAGLFERRVTRQVLDRAAPDSGADPRDTLFDLLMERFEILNDRRAAVHSILAAYKGDPRETLLALPFLGRSMAWMLEAAGLETQGWRGAARIAGLTGVYLNALRAWMADESPDLAKTMAALDQGLARAEEWAGRLHF